MEAGQGSARGRVAIAIGAAVLLGAIIAIVAATSGSDDSERAAVPLPQRCVDAWNNDPAAATYGRHNFSFHKYDGALVTFLTEDAEEVGESEGGLCAVIFPSQQLDAEPFAAGQVLRGRNWMPISALPNVELPRVAELQVAAADAPNAALERTGLLADL